MKARIFTLKGVAIVMFALAIATSVVSALTTITRDVGGSVTAVVNDPDGIEVYLDENLTQVADNVAFGSIKIDLFGTVKEGGAVPVWVHNLSLSTVRLSVDDDFARADVAFDGDGSTLNAGQTLPGELSLDFSSGAHGDFDFTITFNADGPITSSTPNPGYGGTLRFGMIDIGALDPALMGASQAGSVYSELTYDNATVLWHDGEVTPWALESWDSSSDLKQYTFKVRDGIRFHDGADLTSEDVSYTFERILDPSTGSPLGGQIDYIQSIDAPDDNTIVFNLSSANAFLPSDLTDYHARILPSGFGPSAKTQELGSGAYILADHDPAQNTTLRRNPDYWRQNKPYVDEMIFFYMPEQATRIGAIESGAIDVVLAPNFSDAQSLEANSNVLIAETPSAAVRVIDMHTYEGSPFADKNLRKAMQYAVDRDFVRETALFGRGANGNDHPVGINDQYYWDGQPLIQQDIARAKEYLTAAGFPDGIDITLDTADVSQMLDVALAFKESVAEAGINVEVVLHESGPFWENQWMNPCCPFVTSNWGARPAQAALDVQLRSGGVWNESYYNNPRLDELLDLANAEGDLAKRKDYFREIQEILIEDVPVLYLMHAPVMIAHRDRVKGVIAHSGLAHVFAEEWWIED